MLIDDIIRELWLNGPEWMGGVILVYAIMGLVAVGSIIESGLMRHEDHDGLWASAVAFVTIVVILLLVAIVPTSPLIGVTGRLFPSPWAHGLLASVCTTLVIVSLVYGLVSGTIHSIKDFINLLCYGLKRWPWVILLAMLVSFALTSNL